MQSRSSSFVFWSFRHSAATSQLLQHQRALSHLLLSLSCLLSVALFFFSLYFRTLFLFCFWFFWVLLTLLTHHPPKKKSRFLVKSFKRSSNFFEKHSKLSMSLDHLALRCPGQEEGFSYFWDSGFALGVE